MGAGTTGSGRLMSAEAICLGAVIGVLLGALGGGGGVLVVPALVYLLGQSAQQATTGSIVIVGLTAVAGAAARLRAGLVEWPVGLAFGVVGVPAALLGTGLNHHVPQRALMLAFAVLTLASALAMLVGTGAGEEPEDRDRFAPASPDAEAAGSGRGVAVLTRRPAVRVGDRPGRLIGRTVVCGLVVGFLTGFLGVGGGFLVVPALVIALRMPMSRAVGTSLMIIAVNAASSLVARVGVVHLDWTLLVPFTIAAIVASGGGRYVADRLPGPVLTRAFAAMLALVGVLVAAQSLGAF